VGLKLNGTHQLLAYTDDVNLLGDKINTTKKKKETLIDARKEVGLEINKEKTEYMLLYHHQNVGQNRDIKIANRSFENVSQFKYLGTTVTNQNLIHRSNFVLSTHLNLDLSSGLFPFDFPTNNICVHLLPNLCYMPCQSHLP
jgi:hypothetical protein